LVLLLHYLLIIALDFCACLRMANLINVPKLKCIAGWVFTITPEVVVVNTLFLLDLDLFFSMMPKGGRLLDHVF